MSGAGAPLSGRGAGPRLKHRVEYGLFRLVTGLLSALPERVALALGASLGRMGGSVLRIRRADVDRHLALAFPERNAAWRRRVARASYAHLGREAVSTFRVTSRGPAEVAARTTMVGFDAFQAAVAEGKGVILVTGHVGNWELGGAAFSARGLPVDAVAKGMANPLFGSYLEASRRRVGVRLVDLSQAPREALRSLRSGHVLGLIADQNAREQGIFVPFFGREAATFRGPALFALRTGAPIFLGVSLRQPGVPARYRVTVEHIGITPAGDLEEDVRALTAAHTAALAPAERQAPEQHFWQHRRWKTRPPSER
ncbi:MAG: lysophospholipid acyltransferase family protein [Gemmatimonadetes bacterium]|nr:lysophospholipid acyltransferase family protein [Gemmatimonadota bacterium]